MRKIQLKSWEEKGPDGVTRSVNLTNILDFLISSKKPEELPKGFEGAKMFTRLIKAFNTAAEESVLILEEQDYSFLRTLVERDMPATWGKSENIMSAIESFMDAKE